MAPKLLDDSDLRAAKKKLIAMHAQAKIGHLGGNLSCLDAMMMLHHDVMAGDDLFILSKGHAAGAYYITLWSLGLLPEDELASFHADNSRLSGHPSPRGLKEISFASGSLGHGLGFACGLAMAEKLKPEGSRRRIFCLTSDGEWQCGSTLEAYIFACHHRLDALTILIDANGWQGFGTTDAVASMGNLAEKLAALGGSVSSCNGHDLGALRQALGLATSDPSSQDNEKACGGPRVIVMRTRKGHGIPDFEDQLKSHYLPPSPSQVEAAFALLDGAA